MSRTPIGRLRAVGIAEGLSLLLLLGVAMPLKYLAGMPLAVKIVGWIHGVLFILFCVALAQARAASGWSIAKSAGLLLAALLPFGTFVVDGRLRREDAARRGPAQRAQRKPTPSLTAERGS
jgi:integral membrane protein